MDGVRAGLTKAESRVVKRSQLTTDLMLFIRARAHASCLESEPANHAMKSFRFEWLSHPHTRQVAIAEVVHQDEDEIGLLGDAGRRYGGVPSKQSAGGEREWLR